MTLCFYFNICIIYKLHCKKSKGHKPALTDSVIPLGVRRI